MLLPGPAGETLVLTASGEKITLRSGEIEATRPSKISTMPAGLLDPLSLEEIGDLFALLQGQSKSPSLSRRPSESETK
jgi:hypothetical protein